MSLLDTIDKPAPKPAAQKREPRTGGTAPTAIERASAYVAKMPGGVQGAGGSLPCMRAAVACARGFELSVDDTVRVLKAAHNPNCTPEWPEDELRHKATDAAKSERVPLGYLLDAAKPYRGDHGVANESYEYIDDEYAVDPFGRMEIRDDESVALGLTSGAEGPTADDPLRGLKHLAGVALLGRARILELASKPIDFIWKDIVVAGTIVLVAGPPADGKTTLLFLILAARANLEAPISLLGREMQPAPPGQFIIIIEGEHSESSTSRKKVKSLQLLGVDDMALERVIIVARKAVRLGSPEWDDVVRLVRAGLVSDVAIDTVARVAPANADSEHEQVAVFDGVAQAIEQAPDGSPKPTVWAVAHTRKNNTTGELGDVSGSVQRVGQSDTVLMVKADRVDGRVVSTRVIFGKLREDPDQWPEPVELTIAKGADGLPTLSMQGSATGSKQDNQPLEGRVLEQLALGPRTKNALVLALKRNAQDVDVALTNLFTAKAILTTEVTVSGRPRKAFKLRPGAPDGAPDPPITGLGTGRATDGTE